MLVELCDNHLSNSFVIRFRTFFFLVSFSKEKKTKKKTSIRLVLLFVVSLRIDFGKFLSTIEEVPRERRGPPPNPVELAVRKM